MLNVTVVALLRYDDASSETVTQIITPLWLRICITLIAVRTDDSSCDYISVTVKTGANFIHFAQDTSWFRYLKRTFLKVLEILSSTGYSVVSWMLCAFTTLHHSHCGNSLFNTIKPPRQHSQWRLILDRSSNEAVSLLTAPLSWAWFNSPSVYNGLSHEARKASVMSFFSNTTSHISQTMKKEYIIFLKINRFKLQWT